MATSAMLEKAVDDVTPDVTAVLQAYDGVDASECASQIVAAADKLCDTLLEKSLACKDRVRCARMAPHCQNRFGTGVDVLDVHDLLGCIVRTGWRWKEVGHAIAFEKAPDAAGAKQMDDIRELIAASEGMLPPWSDTDIVGLTVACTHATSGLACLHYETKTDQEDLAGTDGRIDKAKVLAMCPSIQDPLERGIEYLIIRSCVEKRFPSLPHFLQEAGHAAHAARKQQTRVQTLMQVHARILKNTQLTGDPNMPKVALAIERIRPWLKDQVEDMCDYVVNFSGGTSPRYLLDLVDFAKGLKVRRGIDGTTFKQLASLPLKQCPRLVTAFAKTML
eukprot:135060-Pyramimonas_sp.AAC.1